MDVGNDAASSCSNAPTPADIFGNFGQAITSILDADPQVMQQIGQMAEAVEGKGRCYRCVGRSARKTVACLYVRTIV